MARQYFVPRTDLNMPTRDNPVTLESRYRTADRALGLQMEVCGVSPVSRPPETALRCSISTADMTSTEAKSAAERCMHRSTRIRPRACRRRQAGFVKHVDESMSKFTCQSGRVATATHLMCLRRLANIAKSVRRDTNQNIGYLGLIVLLNRFPLHLEADPGGLSRQESRASSSEMSSICVGRLHATFMGIARSTFRRSRRSKFSLTCEIRLRTLSGTN